MYLTRHNTDHGPRWAVDGELLPRGLELGVLLTLSQQAMLDLLAASKTDGIASGELLVPIEDYQEVWGSGVTYMRSREAREAESESADVYAKVYDANRPEIFFKASGWRAVGHGEDVRIRQDSAWNVPEPELTLVINSAGEIVGYTVGNDMSSRDIEGENPLYLPQAKTYNGSCGVGPGIQLISVDELSALTVQIEIVRAGAAVFTGETATSNMKRTFQDLADYLYRETSFPYGALLMTGTGIVPPDEFTLTGGDLIRITIGDHLLENRVA